MAGSISHSCQKADTIVHNWMKFKDQPKDDSLPHITPKATEKLEVFHKCLNPVWEWLGQLGPIHQPGTYQLLCNSTPCHRWNTLLPHLCERFQSSPTPPVRTHAMITRWHRFWITKFGNALPCTHHSQENIGWEQIKNAQNTTDCIPPSFQVRDRVFFKIND